MSDTTWFNRLGLGLFVHWGHAATRGWELSWQMTGGVHLQEPPLAAVGCEEYFDNAATFQPDLFDPDDWAERAWNAGARYVVFTTKHHDGYAMFDSALSDHTSAKLAGHDFTREVVDAFRSRGFRIGLYFSIVDWHHEDYPRYTDATVPKPYVVGSHPRATPEAFERYRQFMLGQLNELLTGYGQIDILWLDGEFEYSPAEWRFDEIRQFIRDRQPDCMVNDRCLGHGDFVTPEQQLPVAAPSKPWECCLTMNSTWGYVPDDDSWKSARALLHSFVEAASMGGNLLLNVGPTGRGELPAQAVERLDAFADWMATHAESVRDVEPGLQLWQFHGPSTRRVNADGGERLYLHLVMRPYEHIVARGLPVRRITAVTLLGDGGPLPFKVTSQLKDVHAQNPDPTGELVVDIAPERLDALCSVIAIDLAPATGQS
ncbi:glycosyl hydrolase [Longispora fulva]|uniref:alpha-L-fucosidase n=1 Tax=Longispora fulva TaxID=619741 RepID=A0A8J7GM04_9ACTN|nr:alpha-L-fucosidase [Longispora fulva]MBG6134038.1 alpha-L-fucosidase [Longispora fulva]GIG63556.1 glycosyl hydrolase [Longispora fulva]